MSKYRRLLKTIRPFAQNQLTRLSSQPSANSDSATPRVELLEGRACPAFFGTFTGTVFQIISDAETSEQLSVRYDTTAQAFIFDFAPQSTPDTVSGGDFTDIDPINNQAILSAADANANSLTAIAITNIGDGQTLTLTVNDLTGSNTDVPTFGLLSADANDEADYIDASGQFNSAIGMVFDGMGGDDTIFGGDGSDTILAGAGNDSVDGGFSSDSILGGDGNDSITGGEGFDTLDGGAGFDLLAEFGGSFILTDSSLNGDGQTDAIAGFEQAYLLGGEGSDVLDASGFTAGSVTLEGSSGDDTFTGSPNNDFIFGDSGDDIIIDSGASFIVRQFDMDRLSSGLFTTDSIFDIEQVSLTGTAGDDLLDSSLFGGNATLVGGAGNDSIVGGDGIGDSVMGASGGDDLLLGGDGNDTLTGNLGADTIDGGGGLDMFFAADGIADELVVDENELPNLVSGVNFDEGLDLVTVVPSAEIPTFVFDDIVGVTDLTGETAPYNLDFSAIGSDLVFMFGAGTDSLPEGVTDYIIIDTDFVNAILGGSGNDLFQLINGAVIGSDGTGTLNGGSGTDTIDYTQYGSPAFAQTPDGSATGTGGITSIEIALGISGTQPPPSEPVDPMFPEIPVNPSVVADVFQSSAVNQIPPPPEPEHVSQQRQYSGGSEASPGDGEVTGLLGVN